MDKRERRLRRLEKQRKRRLGRPIPKGPQEPQSEPDPPLVETPEDLRLVQRFMGRADYVIPPKVYDRLPRDLYDAWCNESWKPMERLAAARLLKDLCRANVEKDKTSIAFNFNPTISGVLNPEPPERDDDVVEGEAAPHRPAFVESVSGEDAEKTLKILQELKVEHQIVNERAQQN